MVRRHVVSDEQLQEWASAAAAGDRAAAERLLQALQDRIFRLAVRMLGHPQDAEDATQEILMVVLTHLGSFRGESALTTWVWRIAANHLLRARRGRLEKFTFESVSELLEKGRRDEEPSLPEAELAILQREVRLRCTEALLLSLDRELRIAFVLGEVLTLSNDEAAAVLEIPPATYRKRLSRARTRLVEFLRAQCGIYDPANRCRCRAQVASAMEKGMLRPDELLFATRPAQTPLVERCAEEVDELLRAAAVLRHPGYAAPTGIEQRLRALLASGQLELLHD
jgi:RNA polymerase sigma factor (sigma-70 family)